MKELGKSIHNTRKALRSSKKRVAAIEAAHAEGKRKRGCSGCLKNGVVVMKQRLDQLRITRKKLEKGVIKPDDIHKETSAGMARRRAELRRSKKGSGKAKTMTFKADKNGRVIGGTLPDPRGTGIKGRRSP
jgi:hypothetical protein